MNKFKRKREKAKRNVAATGASTFCKLVSCLLSWFVVLVYVLSGQALATVLPPVEVTLTSTTETARVGEPVSVDIFISSGKDIQIAEFELILSERWELVGGQERWTGALSKEGLVRLQAVVRATQETFGKIRGRVFIPDAGAFLEGSLDLRAPEVSDRVRETGKGRTEVFVEETLQAPVIPKEGLPVPQPEEPRRRPQPPSQTP